jgi:DNA polymerase-3 subunit delta
VPPLSPQAFRAQVASGKTDPVYLIVGDDDHEKSALTVALGEMIEEDLRAFNVERMYAGDAVVSPVVVAEAARTLPMMAQSRVVIVLQAEKLFDPKKKRKAAEPAADEDESAGSLEPLADYFADPSPTTALAFVFSCPEAGKSPADIPLAKNLKITKALVKAATLVVCTGLDGGKDPGRWIEQQAAAAGLTVEREVVARIVQLSGGDTGRLRADVDKLLLFARGAGRLTLEHVAIVSGAPDHHAEEWALVNAVQAGDTRRALRELKAELDDGDNGAPFRILGQLGAAVRNPRSRTPYPPRRIPAALDALLRTDLALKSSGGDPRVLMERLVVELCG